MIYFIVIIYYYDLFHQRYGKITVSGDGLYRAEEDKPAYFYIDTHGMDGTPEVRVEGECINEHGTWHASLTICKT